MTLKYRSLMTITAVGIGLALGWGLGTQQIKAQDAKAPAKVWKGANGGQEEFQLAAGYRQSDGPQKTAWLRSINGNKPSRNPISRTYETKPISAPTKQASMNRQAFDKAVEILKTRPNDFYSLQAIVALTQGLMPVQTADLDNASRITMYILDNADTAFAAANKPATITDAQWPGIKPAMKAAAHTVYLYTITARKDPAREEADLTAYLKKDPTQATTSYDLAGAILEQNKTQPQKQPLALYQFARAAAYTGPGALPAAQQRQVLDYIYQDLHGLPRFHPGTTGVAGHGKGKSLPAGWTSPSLAPRRSQFRRRSSRRLSMPRIQSSRSGATW